MGTNGTADYRIKLASGVATGITFGSLYDPTVGAVIAFAIGLAEVNDEGSRNDLARRPDADRASFDHDLGRDA